MGFNYSYGYYHYPNLAFPERLAEAESILMTQYISMCGLVGAYFGFSAMGNKK